VLPIVHASASRIGAAEAGAADVANCLSVSVYIKRAQTGVAAQTRVDGIYNGHLLAVSFDF
jgi:hypothetical protein